MQTAGYDPKRRYGALKTSFSPTLSPKQLPSSPKVKMNP